MVSQITGRSRLDGRPRLEAAVEPVDINPGEWFRLLAPQDHHRGAHVEPGSPAQAGRAR